MVGDGHKMSTEKEAAKSLLHVCEQQIRVHFF